MGRLREENEMGRKKIEKLSMFAPPRGTEVWCKMIEDRITKLIRDVNLLNEMMSGEEE